MAFKKKLHTADPRAPDLLVETHRTRQRQKTERLNPQRLEHQVRQLLADKVSGTLVGLWLLIPEHLRLGTWDLLRGWAGPTARFLDLHLALQAIHEAALCCHGLRQRRCLSQKGFEIANGLPFVACDQAMHDLFAAHTMVETQALQIALGQVRRASGHFQGRLLAVDPHRLHSWSKRQMVRLKDKDSHPAQKLSQTFFCLDAQTSQPLCFTTASSSRTAAQAAPELLALSARILNPAPQHRPLVLVDVEHYTRELLEHAQAHTPFDLLVPMPAQRYYQQTLQQIPAEEFHPQWIGLATAQRPFHFHGHPATTFTQLIQRTGETPAEYHLKGFLCTAARDELVSMSREYPQRWHVEEFFDAYQDQGWKRAGTLNLNIRYGQMTMALMAQAAIHQLRQRIGQPWVRCEASHLAQKFFAGLDGDLRVHGDTIVVTFYNAPDADVWRKHFEDLPEKLTQEKVNPCIPWLFNYKLDFQFK